MARGATVVQFEIDLSDVDRGVYEALSVSAAQHPSESGAYLAARVLAFALEWAEGLTFTAGLSSGDEPALWVRDLTGQLRDWIEVGTPEGPRLHKASKAATRVAVYCHKDPASWLRGLARERVHDAGGIELFALPPAGVERLADGLARRNAWSLSRVDGVVYLQAGDVGHELPIGRLPWPEA
jgi:uncharacterized protein YaeQ